MIEEQLKKQSKCNKLLKKKILIRFLLFLILVFSVLYCTLCATELTAAAGVRLSVGHARHGPAGSRAGAEVVAGGQAANEGYAVLDVAALESVFKFYVFSGAFLIDFE